MCSHDLHYMVVHSIQCSLFRLVISWLVRNDDNEYQMVMMTDMSHSCKLPKSLNGSKFSGKSEMLCQVLFLLIALYSGLKSATKFCY